MIETFSDADKLLVRYLYRELKKDEATQLEDEMLLDDELAERAEVVEMNLIDCYVRGELSAAERLRFEERFLVDWENRDKVERARVFQKSLRVISDEGQFVNNQGWRRFVPAFLAQPLPAFALVTIVLLLTAALIVFEVRRRAHNTNSLATNSATPAPVTAATPTPENVPAKEPETEIARNDPEKHIQYEYIHRQDWNGAERSNPVVHFTLDPRVKTVALMYQLGDDLAAQRKSYGVTIKNQYGERVWPQNKLKIESKPIFGKEEKRHRVIVVKVPVNVFTDGGPYSFEIDDQYLPAKQFTVKK